ncbi:hypothetical protein GQ53DRAFT_815427 [Thozetella sp. PMI_491]|nr:hypothetical protein GQ53DRAFT_815427 [Thozetella sp. PMI_491]
MEPPQFQEKLASCNATVLVPESPQKNQRDKTGFFLFLISWWKDLAALVVGAAAIAGLGVFLWEISLEKVPYNFVPLDPDSKNPIIMKARQINTNAVLSVFKVVIGFALSFALVRCLVQLTWIWFLRGEDKDLSNYLRFNEAGKQGSLMGRLRMLRFVRLGTLGPLAAFIAFAMLCEYGLDIFIQQTIGIVPLSRPDPMYGHSIPFNASQRYSEFTEGLKQLPDLDEMPHDLQVARLPIAGNYSVNSNQTVENAMKGNIWAGIYASDQNGNWLAPQYVCATGNCTWERFYTSGICSRCASLTPQLIRSPACSADLNGSVPDNKTAVCSLTLSNGFGISGSRWMSITTENPSLAFPEYLEPLLVVQAIMIYNVYPDGNFSAVNSSTEATATECVLFPCGIYYNTTGTSTHESLQKLGLNGPGYYEEVGDISDQYSVNNSSVTSCDGAAISIPETWHDTSAEWTPSIFCISNDAYKTLKKYLISLFNGFGDIQDGMFNFTANLAGYATDALEASAVPWEDNRCSDTYDTTINDPIGCTIISVSNAITVAMRNQLFEPGSFDQTVVIPGTTLSIQAIPEAHWLWLVPVVAMWAFAVIIVVWTMAVTRSKKDVGNFQELGSMALLVFDKDLSSQLKETIHMDM